MHGSAECDLPSGGGSGGIEGSEMQRWRWRAAGGLQAGRSRLQALKGSSVRQVACLGLSRICLSAKYLSNRIRVGSANGGRGLSVAGGRVRLRHVSDRVFSLGRGRTMAGAKNV